MGPLFLPTWTVDYSRFHVGKYTVFPWIPLLMEEKSQTTTWDVSETLYKYCDKLPTSTTPDFERTINSSVGQVSPWRTIFTSPISGGEFSFAGRKREFLKKRALKRLFVG